MSFIQKVFIALAAVFGPLAPVPGDDSPLTRFHFPDRWEERFWASPGVLPLLDLDSKKLADMVPEQAGLKHCCCPKCGAREEDDPLSWSIVHPERLTCRKCAATFPNDKIPAKVADKVPEEVVEILPRHFHHYPYHVIDVEKQHYLDERTYLAAKRDYEAREFLAKLALYAAVKWHQQTPDSKDARLARLSATILLRFAQVYPFYATHFDRAGAPKSFDRADLKPPFRRGYGTAKWDWSGCLDVPMNLVIAYALVKDDPAMAEAGHVLDVSNPTRTIEHDLFRASAEFVRLQPEEYSESSLLAYRGMLAVGKLLNDRALMTEATGRVDEFLGRGFYHDGLWKQGDGAAHKRIVAQLDGWIGRLSESEKKRPNSPFLSLAREASRATWIDLKAETPDVLLASWTDSPLTRDLRRPALLGGANIARLGVGTGDNALDLELRGLGDYGGPPSGRLALRLAVEGRPILGDLDNEGPTAWGFEYASASHSGLVLVDGLNQRETIDSLRLPSPGADLLYFAADRDFQVVRLADRFAYPKSTKVYRHTVIGVSTPAFRYAVSVFDVQGGLQHDQVFHGMAGSVDWKLSVPTQRGPENLLPIGLPFVPTARPEDDRWFVQGMGAFRDLSLAVIDRPMQAELRVETGGIGVRLHLLNDSTLSALTARSPGGSAATDGRASLILRKRSDNGAELTSTFVTVFEPIGHSASLRRVGRVRSDPGVIVIAVETTDGVEYLAINSTPGKVHETALPDGRVLNFDGLAVRLIPSGPILAGGTFANVGTQRVALDPLRGTVVAAGRSNLPGARGVFRISETLPNLDQVKGRTLLIRHGDGTSRGWTIVSAENLEEGGARLHVLEEAGMRIDPESGTAHYERFPGGTVPGPHRFGVSRIGR